MCRLFAMTGGSERVQATFWLLSAPDSLSEQSHREPDGTGLGSYDSRDRPVIAKAPVAAFADSDFATEASSVRSRTFVAHVRYASTGALRIENTHPFEQDGRIFAHNGVIEDLPSLERELGDDVSVVHGDTDSERFFALITREIDRHGDVAAGIASAARWVAANLPVFALNLVLIGPSDLWAMRYPNTHELYVLERAAGGGHLHHRSPRGRIAVQSGALADRPAVVIASERMDDDPGWRLLGSGELLHVGPDLACRSHAAVPDAPAHPLTLADLGAQARSSQAPSAGPGPGSS